MRKTKKKKSRFAVISTILIFVVLGFMIYSSAFPHTMGLLDKKCNEIFSLVNLDKKISFFSDLSEFSKRAVDNISFLIETIKENIGDTDDFKEPVPVYIITNKGEKPTEIWNVSSSFGKRKDPINNKTSYHNGTDISVLYGSDIFAVWPGKIFKIGYDNVYGNYIIIEHSKDFFTKYCHLSKINTEKGEFVKAKEKIAEAGSTGRSTGSHLHFEIIIDGVNINPEEHIKI